MAITSTTLNTSTSAIYTSSGQSVITLGYFCNINGSTRNINLYLVPSGGTANNTNIIYSNVAIASNDTLIISQEKMILSNGDALHANATASGSVVATIGYIGL